MIVSMLNKKDILNQEVKFNLWLQTLGMLWSILQMNWGEGKQSVCQWVNRRHMWMQNFAKHWKQIKHIGYEWYLNQKIMLDSLLPALYNYWNHFTDAAKLEVTEIKCLQVVEYKIYRNADCCKSLIIVSHYDLKSYLNQ